MTENPSNNSDSGDNNNNGIFLREWRRRVLFSMLYRQIGLRQQSGMDDAISDDLDAENMVQTPPLRILSNQEAKELDVKCRFCFEGPEEKESDSPDNIDTTNYNLATERSKMDYRFIAPCSCTGSLEYVHIACLRQWQFHKNASQSSLWRLHNRNSNYAVVCNVCKTPYSLSPLPPPRVQIQKGTFLLRKNNGRGGTFDQSVVLLLSGTHNDTPPFGVIINKKISNPSNINWFIPNMESNNRSKDMNSSFIVSSRNGGPVCGGRLGILRYMVLHNTKLLSDNNAVVRWSDWEIFENEENSSTLRFLEDNETVFDRETPSILESEQVQEFISSSGTASNGSTSRRVVLVFHGFCKWARGQLEHEVVQRDLWHICTNGTEDDILRPDIENLRGDLMNPENGRLISTTQELFVTPTEVE